MACHRCNLLHGRVLPDHNSVVLVAVRRHDFVGSLAPHQTADLRASLDGLELAAELSVEKFDSSVRRASSTRNQVRLVRTPGNSFHSSLVA